MLNIPTVELLSSARKYLKTIPSGSAAILVTLCREEYVAAEAEANDANIAYCTASDYDGEATAYAITFWGEDFRNTTRFGFVDAFESADEEIERLKSEKAELEARISLLNERKAAMDAVLAEMRKR